MCVCVCRYLCDGLLNNVALLLFSSRKNKQWAQKESSNAQWVHSLACFPREWSSKLVAWTKSNLRQSVFERTSTSIPCLPVHIQWVLWCWSHCCFHFGILIDIYVKIIWLSTVSSKWFFYPLTFIMFNRHFVVTISFVLCDPLLVYFVFWCIPPLGNHVTTFVIPFFLFCVLTLTPLPIPPSSDPDDLYILFRSLPHTSRHTTVYQFDLWLDNQVCQVL